MREFVNQYGSEEKERGDDAQRDVVQKRAVGEHIGKPPHGESPDDKGGDGKPAVVRDYPDS